MLVKYTAMLRSFMSVDLCRDSCRNLCKGNKDVATWLVTGSALLKLSKILPATTVYRGVAGEADSSHENSGRLASSTSEVR